MEKVEKVNGGPHVTDEELLLDYYGESASHDRAHRQAHIDSCERCRALDRELRAVLALVDQAPTMEAPPGFGREMWARIEPQITSRTRSHRWSWFSVPRLALAGGMAALLLGAFSLGRVWDTPLSVTPASIVDLRELQERLLQAEVEDHLERSQRVLVDLVNADEVTLDAVAADRERAADLVAAGRLYRRSVEATGDVDTRELLEDVERVLVDVANGPSDGSSKDLTDVRSCIGEQDLILRLRLAASEMRDRERRARPTW